MTTRVRRLLAWLLAVVLGATFAGQAPAAAQTPLGDGRATVRLDGEPLFRVGPLDSLDAGARARAVERRLATLLETPQAVTPARVAPAGAGGVSRALSVAGVPVVTVTPGDAEDNVTTTDSLAARWTAVLDSALARAAARRVSPRDRFIADVRASITAAFSRLLESVVTLVPRGLAAALVLLLFWGIARGVRRLLRFTFTRALSDRTLENLIWQVGYYAVWALGILLAVDALGFSPQTLVTGLGLTGVAFGFALRDVLSNYVAGVLILAQRPFDIGDQIVIGDVEGDVERIRLRATDIRTYDGRLVLVPNAELFGSKFTNNTASPRRATAVPFYVGYGTDLRRVSAVVLDAVRAAPGVLVEPATRVRVRELGRGDITLEARFWTDSRRADFTATEAAVRDAIVAALPEAGIAPPDPNVRFLVPRDPERWHAALGVAPADPEANPEPATDDGAGRRA